MQADANPSPAKAQRLLALDAFRGATILAMILVNNPGTWGSMFWPLGHATWHGWTPTDLIFPFFMFIVGTALAYSLRKYREGASVDRAVYGRIGRRTLTLIALGLGMALFGKLCDVWWKGADGVHLETLRWPGVLQRIGLGYCAASLIVLLVGVRGQVAIAVVLLAGYWALLHQLPGDVPAGERLTQEGNVVRAVDLAVIGKGHMYTQATSEPTDPEGLLSTLPAVVTVLMGYWCGLVIQRREVHWRTVWLLIGSGLLIAAVGQVWHLGFPINKKLWTSSFVLLTGGLGAAGLGTFLGVFDVAGRRSWARPLEIVGVNAIFAFVGSGLLARLISSIPVGEQILQRAIYERLFVVPLGDGPLASLGFALLTVAFWWGLLALMARRGWSIRV